MRARLAAYAAVVLTAAVWVGWDVAQRARDAALTRDLVEVSGVDALHSFHQQVDAAREFINANSQHNMNDEFYAEWHHVDVLKQGVLAHAKGQTAKLQPLECSTRSRLLADMLRVLGYRVRTIHLYSEGLVESHTFIDVLNPASGRWETQDADYNTYWQSKSGERVSIVDVAANPKAYVPCGPDTCG